MSDEALCDEPLSRVAELIKDRTVSSTDVVEATLARIERLGKSCNCYITVTADRAREQALALDKLVSSGIRLGPLHGIPISYKDNIASANVRTTAGSAILRDLIPDRNAAVLDRLTAAGAVMIGKANLYEFAFGAPHPLYGPTKNPWNLTHGCGGSSSGSASAVAAGMCHGSIGTDTGGSIRIPAAFCGVIGFKPTYGRVSRAGVVPLSANLDHVGPLTRTVRDAAILLEAMSGADRADPTAINRPSGDFTSKLEAGVRGLRLGLLAPQATERLQTDVRGATTAAYRVFEGAGANLVEVQLPDLTEVRAACWTIMRAEAAEYHRPYLRSKADQYHPTVRTLIEGGEFIPATEYVHAQRVRSKAAADVRSALDGIDALLLPAVAMAAYPIGQKTVDLGGYEEDVLSAMTRYTPLFNLTGHPALVLPCGFSSAGMPIGLQVVSKLLDDAMVLRVAHTYESLTEWHQRRPRVVVEPAQNTVTVREA
jgi:aspartyl-tRNA(Asn)/glutamyl-tRNA(Gln) amidotransferase subunit A